MAELLAVLPPPQSLKFRATLASLISPLKRVRSRTPFFRLPAHRIPTLWNLYRGLLRHSENEDIKFRIRALFRQNRHLTGVAATREKLEQGYKWLEFFQAAINGDTHRQKVVARYARLIAEKRAKADLTRVIYRELESQLRTRTSPIWTGTFLRPTIYHGPLPRMKPQPEHVSMLIKNRTRARERRIQLKAKLLEDLNDLVKEFEFERGVKRASGLEGGEVIFGSREVLNEWAKPIQECLKEIALKEKKERERANTSFPPSLVSAIFEARREKIRNKTREKRRECQGELTLSAMRRARKGPPAHILAKMSPERKKMDKVARSLSEVGYVALVKRRLGRNVVNRDDGEEEEAGLELGKKENRALLDKAREMIRIEDRRRREQVETWIKEQERALE